MPPWFVRTSGYLGAGPAEAWQTERHVCQGATLDLHLIGALFDHRLDTVAAANIYETLEHI